MEQGSCPDEFHRKTGEDSECTGVTEGRACLPLLLGCYLSPNKLPKARRT